MLLQFVYNLYVFSIALKGIDFSNSDTHMFVCISNMPIDDSLRRLITIVNQQKHAHYRKMNYEEITKQISFGLYKSCN